MRCVYIMLFLSGLQDFPRLDTYKGGGVESLYTRGFEIKIEIHNRRKFETI